METNVPNLFNHLVTVYRTLENEAVEETYAGQVMKTWEGPLVTKISDILGFSTPYYSKVTVPLKSMGCIKQLRRGGGSSMSMWQLIKPPTLEDFAEYNHGKSKDKRKTSTKVDSFTARLDSFNLRLIALENLMQTIINEQIESGKQDPLLNSYLIKQEMDDDDE